MNIQIFNYVSIYWCRYMLGIEFEYWKGFHRKKILTLGRFTIWLRDE